MSKPLDTMSRTELLELRETIFSYIQVSEKRVEDANNEVGLHIHMLEQVEKRLNGHSEIAAAFNNCFCIACHDYR